tara:strand:+ start:1632 stop:3419 length:1788 start_codon:yes stop_codon:yes gene_type:complete
MCGIFGAFGKKLFSMEIETAYSSIKHRGPDDFHYINDENKKKYSIAAVRLAFQDEKNGRQPIYKSINGSKIILSFNGEIYNFKSIINDLNKEKNINLKTNSDTEVLLELYLKFGIKFYEKIKGMFAISIWDERFNKGYLLTDFLAQKPIFYYYDNKILYYSSEINSLKKIINNGILNINSYAINDLLTLSCIINGETIYNQIKRLKPAELLEYDLETKNIKTQITKQFNSKNVNDSLSESAIIEKVKNLLLKAVDTRIDNNKKQSIYLSGGLDSSLIGSICRYLYPKIEINSFNLKYKGDFVYKEKDQDSYYAELISKKINSNHIIVQTDPKDLDKYLEEIIIFYGEPFAGVPSMWLVSKEIRKYSKYSISGDGADELFGSYFTHRKSNLDRPKTINDNLLIIANYYDSFINKNSKNLINRLNSSFKNFSNNFKFNENPLRNQLLIESQLIFPYKVLNYIDRLSMRRSLEPRSPFLDKDLWEFCFSIKDKYRINKNNTKYILKKVAESFLPKEIIYREKEGFVFPLYPYLISNKDDIKNRLNKLIDSEKFFIPKIINRKWIDEAFKDIEIGKRSEFKKSQVIHTLNVLSIWNNIK